MNRTTVYIIAVISIIGGLLAYGYSDLKSWSKEDGSMFYELLDGVFSLLVCSIMGLGMYLSAKSDEKTISQLEEQARVEEIRQKVVFHSESKPVPPIV